jgi:hypothetical protein
MSSFFSLAAEHNWRGDRGWAAPAKKARPQDSSRKAAPASRACRPSTRSKARFLPTLAAWAKMPVQQSLSPANPACASAPAARVFPLPTR